MTRWRSADEPGYVPAELKRLGLALAALHQLAHPGYGAIVAGTRGIARESGSPDPDPIRREARLRLKRALVAIDRLAAGVYKDSKHDHKAQQRGWRCEHCQRGQRFGARFCDRCGAPEPMKATG